MIEINYEQNTKCPVCGKELVVIDNYNYVTMICTSCKSTVFEELDNTRHIIKNGIMEDGYNSSLDIFYKQFITYSLYARSLSKSDYAAFWQEKKMIGLLGNEDIFADGIYDYFVDKIEGFKMKQPCIYFNGYEKYLKISTTDANEFKKKILQYKREII